MNFFLNFWRKTKNWFSGPRLLFPLMTGAALLWFFIRVIPNPARAAYPCQQAAFPMASAFVLWLVGLKAGLIAWLRRKKTWWKKNRRFVFGGAGLLVAVLLTTWMFVAFAADWVPGEPPNSPMGVARGIHPGRVVWVHDPTVTTFTGSGSYYGSDQYTSVSVAGSMISKTIQKLTDATTDADAWDALFKFYNQNHGRSANGYQAGEKICVKVNCNNYSTAGATHDNKIDATPQMVKALLRQLVNTVGVAQTNITVYDCQRYVTWLHDYCAGEFPDVQFRDKGSVTWMPNMIHFATNAVDSASAGLPDFVVNTTYLINMALLKRHCQVVDPLNWSDGYGQTAITCCMKNNFGTSGSPSGMHTMIRDWRNGMGSYNALVDLNGSKYLEGKTVLYLLDGLFSGTKHNSSVYKWSMAPFNGNYPCSVFGSQDMVAIDSVALDFIRTEMGVMPNADNFLHEAALANNPPSGFVYAPDGTRLPSLGVHEHWNNATSKQYSRNLNPNGTGIELVAVPSSLVGSFGLSVTPASQHIVAGSNAVYSVSYLTTGFANDVTLSVSGLPPGVIPIFVPSTVNTTTTNSTLTILTTGSTPDGSYPLVISGIGGGQTNTTAATLIIGTVTATPGTLFWTRGGADANWSTPENWTNLTTPAIGPPGISNDVVFNNTAFGQTNLDDFNTSINSLWFGLRPPSGGTLGHTIVIQPGKTLNITGTNILTGSSFTTAGYSLLVGTNTSVSGNGNGSSVFAAISGSGTLNINRPDGVVAAAEYINTGNHPLPASSTRAVLDLSGLDNFSANISQLLIGCMANGSSGTLLFAKTNTVTAAGGTETGTADFDIGNNGSNPGDPSYAYLGLTNRINVNVLRAGGQKGYWGLLAFNPAFTGQNPTAVFRGTAGSTSRVGTWLIADLSGASGTANVTCPRGTNDFTGGSVDAMVENLVLGKTGTHAESALSVGTSSNRVSAGTLTFNAGTINVNNLTNGWQVPGDVTDTGIGQINVNGGALTVNNKLVLAAGVSSSYVGGNFDGNNRATNLFYGTTFNATNAFAQGTLNINSGTVRAGDLVAGGGISLVAINNGTLILTNTAGSPGSAIQSFAVNNSTLHLNLNGSAIVTNIIVTNLVANGVNTISIDSAVNVSGPVTFPLIRYNSFTGSVAANFIKGELPAGFTAGLVDNPAQHRIDLVIAASASVVPHIHTAAFSGTGFIVGGSNGLPEGNYYVLVSTNLALPLNQWTPIATNPFDAGGGFNFTNLSGTNASQLFYLLQLP